MTASRSLPVLIPKVPDQRWSCHSCGNCCRTLVGHVSEEERKRLNRQGWPDRLGVAPCVRVGHAWVLNKKTDGACVFLDDHNRCRIHAEFGETSKPLACRIFPFSVRPVESGWQASLRFDCPSVIHSKGQPLSQHKSWLMELTAGMDHHGPSGGNRTELQQGVWTSGEEAMIVERSFRRWLEIDQRPLTARLIGAARVTATLAEARLGNVPGGKLAELLDVLFGAAQAESQHLSIPPTPRQRGMLRQLAFAHAEHVTLEEMRAPVGSRLRIRWRQLRAARRMLKGQGGVPGLRGFAQTTTFEAVERVQAVPDEGHEMENLVLRYLLARLDGRSVFGDGYYGWPLIPGFAALWLSVPAVGWLARYRAAASGRPTIELEDVGHSLGIVDRAATRLPALGAFAERARVRFLLTDDGLARLIGAYVPWGSRP